MFMVMAQVPKGPKKIYPLGALCPRVVDNFWGKHSLFQTTVSSYQIFRVFSRVFPLFGHAQLSYRGLSVDNFHITIHGVAQAFPPQDVAGMGVCMV